MGSIAVQPGNSDVVFAASGRAVLGVSNTCCGGVDALIPGAPHFGLYRSLNGGANWELVNQGAPALCTALTPDQVALNQTPCAPRGARRVKFDPVDPNVVYVSFFSRGIWRSRDLGNTWEQIMPLLGAARTTERAEFDVVQLGGETRMYVGVGAAGCYRALPPQRCGPHCPRRHGGRIVDRPHEQQRGERRRLLQLRLLRRPVLATTTTSTCRPGRAPTRSTCSATTSTTRTTTSAAARTAAPCCCPPTPASTSPT